MPTLMIFISHPNSSLSMAFNVINQIASLYAKYTYRPIPGLYLYVYIHTCIHRYMYNAHAHMHIAYLLHKSSSHMACPFRRGLGRRQMDQGTEVCTTYYADDLAMVAVRRKGL